MIGGELLVPLAKGEALRRLDKTFGAIGVAIEIHGSDLSRAPPRPEGPWSTPFLLYPHPTQTRRLRVVRSSDMGKICAGKRGTGTGRVIGSNFIYQGQEPWFHFHPIF